MRGLSTVLVLLALMLAALPSHAQSSDAPQVQENYEHVWYGPKLAIFYGSAYVAGTGAVLILRNSDSVFARAGGSILLGGGALTAIVGTPLTHWSYDNFGKGLASMGGQFGSALAGGLIGAGIGAAAGEDKLGTPILLGALTGHVAWALVDIFALGRQERLLSVETSARVVPRAWFSSDGFTLGVAAIF